MPPPPGHEKPRPGGQFLTLLQRTWFTIQKMWRSPSKLLQCALIAGFVFALDLNLGPGVAAGVGYVVLVLMGFLFAGPRPTFILAGAGSVLTLIGMLFSDPLAITPNQLANLGLALLAIWVSALLIAREKRAAGEIGQGREEMEGRIEERTHALLLGVRERERALSRADAAHIQAEKLGTQLSDAIESMIDGVILFDAEDRFVLCNERQRTMFPPIAGCFRQGNNLESILRATAEHNLASMDAPEAEAWIAETLAAHRGPGGSVEQNLPDGRWILTRRFRTQNGGMLVIQADISERKRTEQRLHAAREQAMIANRAKSELLANMSHELRTPLNAIIGFAGVLGDETFGPLANDKQREYLKDIEQSGQHLLELINDILDVSAIEAGKLTLNQEDIDPRETIEAAIRLISPRALIGGIDLARDMVDDLPLVRADGRRLKQILLNLLSNAVKFSRQGGCVTLGARRDADGGIQFSITDTGIGMDQDGLALALAPFGQVDGSLAREYEGSGLGLPLSLALVEMHGGRLELESAPGEGTTARVHLPASRVIDQA